MSEENESKVVNFTILERMNFGSILPEKADFLTITLKKDILEKITLTPEEGDQIELKAESLENGMMDFKWNREKEFEKKITFTKLENELICKELSAHDSMRTLTDGMHSIYKKFIKLD